MNPFIPIKKAKLAIVAGNADQEIIDSLEKLGLEVIPTIRCQEVYDSISYHPDIVIHPINHNSLIIAPNVFDYYREVLHKFNFNLIKGEKYLGCKYPDNIAYNIGRLSKIAIHNFKYTDKVLKFYLEKENINLINIKQGYSKCSLAIVGDRQSITADVLLYNKLKALGYDTLLIDPGHISLPGQTYGFIGGTSGSLSENTVMFSGSLGSHPDRKKIINFLSQHNKKPLFLSKKSLMDIGTIISL